MLSRDIDLQQYLPTITTGATKIFIAIILWFIGRWLINFTINFLNKSMNTKRIDPTLIRYLSSIIRITLNVILIVGLLGYFGVETTTFAAVIAAAGIAIGMAWAGLLSNFAAGAFLILLRPFKTGDIVCVSGITGTVMEIGMFATKLNTMDNILTIIGNSKIFNDNIQNFTANPYRRLDIPVQLAHSTDPLEVATRLKEAFLKIPNVKAQPAPEIDIAALNQLGTLLSCRVYCHNDHYAQVLFACNLSIRDSLKQGGYTAPVPTQTIVLDPPMYRGGTLL